MINEKVIRCKHFYLYFKCRIFINLVNIFIAALVCTSVRGEQSGCERHIVSVWQRLAVSQLQIPGLTYIHRDPGNFQTLESRHN